MWVSRGGLPIGLTIGGYHHGATHQAENRHRARRREIGALGVRRHARGRAPGKRAHSQRGRRHRRLYAQYPGAPVVVDQVRNIGSLALSRAKLAGMPRAYLPRLAAHGASKLFAGDAKTDERDAMVIAKTAPGIPDALLAVADRPPEIEAARSLAAQRDFLTCENTRSKNRLRSILLESCPEFEAQADLSDPATLKLMAAVGGPWSISGASPQAVGALTRGCGRAKVAALVESAESSSRPRPAAVACEDRAVRLLARRISENAAEIESLASEISALLAADETRRCLLTVPGIGPRTASELVISIDIADFAAHDRLASRCGLAPRNRRSGTSISSVSASRQGNKELKNLLIFSCNCLAHSRNRWTNITRAAATGACRTARR